MLIRIILFNFFIFLYGNLIFSYSTPSPFCSIPHTHSENMHESDFLDIMSKYMKNVKIYEAYISSHLSLFFFHFFSTFSYALHVEMREEKVKNRKILFNDFFLFLACEFWIKFLFLVFKNEVLSWKWDEGGGWKFWGFFNDFFHIFYFSFRVNGKFIKWRENLKKNRWKIQILKCLTKSLTYFYNSNDWKSSKIR